MIEIRFYVYKNKANNWMDWSRVFACWEKLYDERWLIRPVLAHQLSAWLTG